MTTPMSNFSNLMPYKLLQLTLDEYRYQHMQPKAFKGHVLPGKYTPAFRFLFYVGIFVKNNTKNLKL